MRGGNGNIFINSDLAHQVAQYCDAAGTLLVSDAKQERKWKNRTALRLQLFSVQC